MHSAGFCRMLGSAINPLLELGGHSHWVWQAKFNPHHDSLLLSTSSDCLANLWHTPLTAGESNRGQVGSRGLQGGAGGQSKGFGKEVHDGMACSYDDHEDSVYGKHTIKSRSMSSRHDCFFLWRHVGHFTANERMHSNKSDPCHFERSQLLSVCLPSWKSQSLSACLPSRHSLLTSKTINATMPHEETAIGAKHSGGFCSLLPVQCRSSMESR